MAIPEQEYIFIVGKQLIDVFFRQLLAGFYEFDDAGFILFGHKYESFSEFELNNMLLYISDLSCCSGSQSNKIF
jgi:hypothetical protein